MSGFRGLVAIGGGILLEILAYRAAAVAEPEKVAAVEGPSPKIALLDASLLLNADPEVQAIRQEQEGGRANEELDKQKIAELQARLKDLVPGSEQHRSVEREIATRMADLNAKVLRPHKDHSREWATYYRASERLAREVRDYAAANRITIVLKYDSAIPNPDDPNSVIGAINNPVIYAAEGMDITPIILERLRKQGGEAVDGSETATRE